MAICTHLDHVLVTELPEAVAGCEDCLAIGDPWLHLRICLECGHVGCCDDSPNRHATNMQRRRSTRSSARSSRARSGRGATWTRSRWCFPRFTARHASRPPARRLKRRSAEASNGAPARARIDLCQPVGSRLRLDRGNHLQSRRVAKELCPTRGVLWALRQSAGSDFGANRRGAGGLRAFVRICCIKARNGKEGQAEPSRVGRGFLPSQACKDQTGRSRLGLRNLDYRAQVLRLSVTPSALHHLLEPQKGLVVTPPARSGGAASGRCRPGR